MPPGVPPSLTPRSIQGQGLATPAERYWRRLGWKIALMGAHLTPFLSLFNLVVLMAMFAGVAMPSGVYATIVGWSVIGVPLSWLGGFITTGLTALVCLPLVALSLWVMGERPPRDTTGLIAGSAVAFTMAMSNFVNVSAKLGTVPLSVAFLWLLVVLVTVAAAQAGGLLGSLGDLRRRYYGRLVGKPIRFTVWRLLAATGIVSVVLSLMSFAELLTAPVGIVLVFYFIVAISIYRPVRWATNRWLDWRLRVRRRKRRARLAAAVAAV